MAGTTASLVKDTAIYGLTTISVKLLSWLMTIVYSRILTTEGMGTMSNLYAWSTLLMIILTYGMETGFFRFINKPGQKEEEVYSTILRTLLSSSLFFIILGIVFMQPVSNFLNNQNHPEMVAMLFAIIGMDAFMSVPFAYLRHKGLAWKFMSIRVTFILLTLLLTGLWVIFTPQLKAWQIIREPADMVPFVFYINLICCIIQLLMLSPYWAKQMRGGYNRSLIREILKYSWPILLLGLAGSFNNQADKIIFPMLFDDPSVGKSQLGIYAACYKIAIIMAMLTQAFRYAYDPFVFGKTRESEEEQKKSLVKVMQYYIIFTCFVFLGVMCYLDILKYMVSPPFYPGLPVVPWAMLGLQMFGIYYNLSVWYKVTDRTIWGAVFSIIGCVMTVLIIIIGAPLYGFMACAWAAAISNGVIMVLSYVIGRRYFPVNYKLGNAAFYALLTGGLVGLSYLIRHFIANSLLSALACTPLLLVFILVAVKKDVDLNKIPIVNKYIKKK
ncbi:polysaccharide biosynthesis protein [Porphyromonas macacae]|uniref:Polysaccharide biosynthesis protein n=1 Tax=Porphyromonas macacae TaxID=28115 RepID=A0A0A2E274_9PORP|nr:lipopolysaccharide biosynthesis protein [Porphyromonas macacae]KGN72993.1 polysaccharide biosynthesis protein [Porphyromonas macacae]